MFKTKRGVFCLAILLVMPTMALTQKYSQGSQRNKTSSNVPTLSSISPTSVTAGGPAFTLTAVGTNFGNNSVVLWNGASVSTTIVSSTQATAAIPDTAIAAAGTVQVAVYTPGRNGGTSNVLYLTIGAATTTTTTTTTSPLAVTTLSIPAGTIGTAYSATLSASGGTTPYSWTAGSGIPPGITLSSAGALSGTPTTSGSYSFPVQVKDSASNTASYTYSVSIGASTTTTSTALSITTGSTLPSGTQGTAYSTTLGASGGTAPYKWSITSGSLPAGITLTASTGALSGTPTASGGSTFAGEVTDATGSAYTKSFTISVAASTTTTPLAISTASLPAGMTGTAYSASLAASGGRSPYAWSVSSGALPAGVSLASGGALSGTPTTAGSSSFTAQVKDSAGGVSTQTYSVSIATGVSVTTASLPSATAGTAYSATLAAAGGTSPYTWSVASGNTLPAGLALSTAGALSGTPTTANTYTFSVQAKDSAGGTATKSYSMSVAASTTTTAASLSAIAVAALPQYIVDTTFPNTTGYVVKTVCASDCDYSTVQAAANNIHNVGGDAAGEVIELASGATFTEHVNFPAYTMGPGKWVIVTTNTSPSNLPPPGVRINPNYSPVLAKIVTNTTPYGAVNIASQGNHYWFMGLELSVDPSLTSFTNAVFQIGPFSQASVADLPSSIVIDRCYIHGTPAGNIRRGIKGDGVAVAVINSWISDFHDTASDTQTFWAFNSPGPFLIQNNELEAAGENVLFGAYDPTIPYLVPSDITIVGNHFFKPLSWWSSSPTYAGILWQVKNLLEFKNAQRVLVQGNVLENNWVQAQTGWAILITPRNAGGTCTWCTAADITFAYNIVRHSGSVFQIMGADFANPTGGMGPSQPSQRLNIHDNLFYDINGPKWGGADGIFVEVVNAATPTAHDIIVNHNTVAQTGIPLFPTYSGYTTTNFAFVNNVLANGPYGVKGAGAASGTSTLNAYFPGAVFTNNALENLAQSGMSALSYPTGNFFPAAWINVPFADSTDCPAGNLATSQIGLCALASTSPYLASGTDRGPLGADIKTIYSLTANVAP